MQRPQLLELADRDTLERCAGPVAKLLGDTMCGCWATRFHSRLDLKVAPGHGIVVHVENHGDLETTVHWHGPAAG